MIEFDVEDFDGTEDIFAEPGYFERFSAAVGDEQFRETARAWGQGAATAAILTVVSYTVRFIMALGGEEHVN